jgi:hypothetical protein
MRIDKAVEEYSKERDEAQFQGARKHGAFSYLNRTRDNKPIPKDLAFIESQVIEDIDQDGPLLRIKKQASRLATAAELLWGYMASSPDNFRKGLKQWGWLAGAEIRAWRDYEAMAKSTDDDVITAKVLEAYSKDE